MWKIEIVKTIIMLQNDTEKRSIPALKKPIAEVLVILIVISTLPGINREEKKNQGVFLSNSIFTYMWSEGKEWLEIPWSKDKLSLAVHCGKVAQEIIAVHPCLIY